MIPVLIAVECAWWYVATWQNLQLGVLGSDTERIAYYLTTSVGSNYMKAQVVFAAFFALVYYSLTGDTAIVQLVRYGRKSFAGRMAVRVFLTALVFSFVIVMVQCVLAVISQPLDYLLQWNYFRSMLFYYVTLVFFYTILGWLFVLLEMVFSNILLALVVYFIVNVVLMGLAFYRFVPTIYLMLDSIQWGVHAFDPSKYGIALIIHAAAGLLLVLGIKKRVRNMDFL